MTIKNIFYIITLSLSLITNSFANSIINNVAFSRLEPTKQDLIHRSYRLPEGSRYLGKHNLNGIIFDNCYSIPDSKGLISNDSVIECGSDLGN